MTDESTCSSRPRYHFGMGSPRKPFRGVPAPTLAGAWRLGAQPMALGRDDGGLGGSGRAYATPKRGIAPPRSVTVLALLTILAGCVAPSQSAPPIALHEPGYLPAYPPREDIPISNIPVEARPIQESQSDLVQLNSEQKHSVFILQTGDVSVCH